MNITTKATGLDLTPSLKIYVERKLGIVGRLVSKFDLEGAVAMRVEVGRTTAHHHKGTVFTAEVNLLLPGATLRAVSEHEDVRSAIDAVQKKLKLEIAKYKTKHAVSRRN